MIGGKTLLVAFSLGFILYLLCVLPIIQHHGGLFFYYGDYNVQQVPFYVQAHRAVRSGNFHWNWNLDLGGSMVGDFAFYLWGSPFFWLTVPFPESAIPYLLPFLMALKFGTATLTSALYMRRYVRTGAALLSGSLLYAFSGFQACNIVFQHFADVIAFFPLLLLAFDSLMFLDHRKGERPYEPAGWTLIRFSLITALMAVVNYYFFFGQVIFLLLYFVIRYAMSNPWRVWLRMFLRALAGGVLGVLLASFFLLPAFFGVSGNSRLSDVVTGYNLLVYESMKLPYAIVKSFVMIPDIIGKGTLFYTEAIRNSSLAAYLPMFGVSGVAAFFFAVRKKKDWRKTLLIVCALIAFVPVLNSMFSLFNNQYYARWFYMPLFFMTLITAQQLDHGREEDWKAGVLVTVILFLFMLAVALLPSRDDSGTIVYLNMTDNPDLFWRQVKGTAIMIFILVGVIWFVRMRILRRLILFAATILACFITTNTVLTNGASLINDFGMKEWKKQMIDTKPELKKVGFYRIETDSTSTNYEMYWNIPTIHCFLSTVPGEIFDFYEGTAGIYRTVESDAAISRVGLRAILSAGYYLENSIINTNGDFSQGRGVEGYRFVEEQNDFSIYENENFIPMGFTYRYFVRESVFDQVNKADADQALVRVLILSDEDADRYGENMKELPADELTQPVSAEDFALACMERRESACTDFLTDDRGFFAETADLPVDSLVFFSVPAVRGFTATVDGESAEIVKADYGLMAVPVSAGIHRIRVTYETPGRIPGILLTLLGIAGAAGYLFWNRRRRLALEDDEDAGPEAEWEDAVGRENKDSEDEPSEIMPEEDDTGDAEETEEET